MTCTLRDVLSWQNGWIFGKIPKGGGAFVSCLSFQIGIWFLSFPLLLFVLSESSGKINYQGHHHAHHRKLKTLCIFQGVEFDCFISLSPFLRSGDRGGVTPRQQNLKSAHFCNPRPVDTLYGTVSSIFTIRLFSIELVFMSSLGGCLVDSRILGECIKCHYLDVTEEGEGRTNKISWKM